MSKASPGQVSFSSGEISPLAAARVDADQYKNGLKTCLNLVPTALGPATHRPGTYFTAATKDSTKKSRLRRFEFSTTQAYAIEFGDLYCRFYKDNAQITLTAQAITGITNANPAVVTYGGADTYANGDKVLIAGVVGMTQVNNREFTIANVNVGANTFELSGVDSTAYGTYASGGTVAEIYTIATPYLEADLFQLEFVQSADVLYIAHPSYAQRKLSRSAHTSWTLSVISFTDGPYLNQNTTTTTLTPLAAINGPATAITNAANNGAGLIRITSVAHGLLTGDGTEIENVVGTTEANEHWIITRIDANNFDLQGSAFVNAYISGGTSSKHPTLTASSIVGINNDTGFQATDVGRWIRLKETGVWGWCEIVHYISPTVVIVHVWSTLTNTNAKLDWRMGAWSDTTGYPGAVAFYEDRLVFAGSTNDPHRIDGSKTGAYENFSPTDTAGVVANDNAISFTLNSGKVNRIFWLENDEKGLLAGTFGGCWVLRPSILSEALTPTNVSAKQFTNFGSKNVQALRAGRACLYVQREGRTLREISYGANKDGFGAKDSSIVSGHITKSGLTELAYQQYPHEIVWAARTDGALVGMLYSLPESEDAAIRGWHRHTLGGVFGSGSAVVESVAVLPSADGTYEQLWLIVKRTINGATVRTVEYMKNFFETDVDAVEDAFFVDCGLTYSGVATTTIGGLWHLEGQTVTILADGSAHPTKVVTNGTVTLDRSATKVHVGLYQNADGETLRFEAGAKDGTAQGKTQRINHCVFRLDSTVGLKYGRDFNNLDEMLFRESGDTTGAAIPLFTGDKGENFTGDYSTEARVCFRQHLPLPFTLLGIYPQITTQDKN